MSSQFALSPLALQAVTVGGVLISVVTLVPMWIARRNRARRIERFALFADTLGFIHGPPGWMRWPFFILPLMGIVFWAFALAQPLQGDEKTDLPSTGQVVAYVLDTSESMNAGDAYPTRLDAAKTLFREVARRRPGDSAAICVYSGGGTILCPLTSDVAFLASTLESLDTNQVGLEGSNAEMGIRAAMEALSAAQGDDASASMGTVVLATDGEGLYSENCARVVLDRARLVVVGVGTKAGSQVRSPDGAATHTTSLDEPALRQLAGYANGLYIPLGVMDEAVRRVVGYIGEGSHTAQTQMSSVIKRNLFQAPLAGAALCFYGEGVWLVVLPWITRRWRRKDVV